MEQPACSRILTCGQNGARPYPGYGAGCWLRGEPSGAEVMIALLPKETLERSKIRKWDFRFRPRGIRYDSSDFERLTHQRRSDE